MKKVLFIDRDGTLALEPQDYQLDALDKLQFYPEVFKYLGKIAKEMDYELVMVTNQDGLGTDSFPEETFWPTHNFLMKTFENEGITFSEVCIDKSFPADMAETRKPRTGMLTSYLDSSKYTMDQSYVIGDRMTDMELAKNLGARGIFIANDEGLGARIEFQFPQQVIPPNLEKYSSRSKQILVFLLFHKIVILHLLVKGK